MLNKQSLFSDVIAGLSHEDVIVRMRCADVAEKVSIAKPIWLAPYKRTLLSLALHATEQELCWHLAQMLPRLNLSPQEHSQSVAILMTYLKHKSRIVQTFALQALFDLARADTKLQSKLIPMFEVLALTGSAAVSARARKLIHALPEHNGAN